MEEEFEKKGLMRAPMASNIRSKRTIVDANWEKFVDKAQEGSKSSYSVILVMVLVMSFQCPSKPFVFFKNPHFYLRQQRDLNQPELEEEICEPLNVNLKVNFGDLYRDDESMIRIIHPLLTEI
ncbi:hypothetical protein CFP56_002386 [Quercus suber]|uniref:Uncharacterized protein n=1 Tax=Quercus suber TaxID=58331 RepID=A0AAW0LE18_QUESU